MKKNLPLKNQVNEYLINPKVKVYLEYIEHEEIKTIKKIFVLPIFAGRITLNFESHENERKQREIQEEF